MSAKPLYKRLVKAVPFIVAADLTYCIWMGVKLSRYGVHEDMDLLKNFFEPQNSHKQTAIEFGGHACMNAVITTTLVGAACWNLRKQFRHMEANWAPRGVARFLIVGVGGSTIIMKIAKIPLVLCGIAGVGALMHYGKHLDGLE